jgi:serine/threonine protein phosphatase PrpC
MNKSMPQVDMREGVAVAYAKGTKHRYYEDAFRMLSRDVPLIGQKKRGEVFAVFDGIGSAPEGRHAAQVMADTLVRFFREPDVFSPSDKGMLKVLEEANMEICSWGFVGDTDLPLGGCAGTVIWLFEEELHVYHAGDTTGLLLRDDNIKVLTRDHQTEDGAIFRYFGIGDNINIDIDVVEIEEGDRILLVSDGITKQFSPSEAGKMVQEPQRIQTAVRNLVHHCQLAGETDDITAMLVEVEEFWQV